MGEVGRWWEHRGRDPGLPALRVDEVEHRGAPASSFATSFPGSSFAFSLAFASLASALAAAALASAAQAELDSLRLLLRELVLDRLRLARLLRLLGFEGARPLLALVLICKGVWYLVS